MSKIYTIVTVTIGVMILMNMVGMSPPVSGFVWKLLAVDKNAVQSTTNLTFINYSSKETGLADTESSSLLDKGGGTGSKGLLAILALLGTAGIAVSFLVKSPPTDYLVAPFISFIGSLLLIDLGWLFGELWRFGLPYNMIAMLIFAPWMGGLIIALYEFWRFGG